MNSQKIESDRLRRQLEATGDDIVQSNEAISARIQEVVEQERKQAAEERTQLLTQIAGLITSQAQREEKRLAEKTSSVQQSLRESNKTFQGGMNQFTSGMDAWTTKETELVAEVNKNRLEVRKKFQDDWTAANQHSTSIQATTKSVHAETVRVVEEQIADLDTQMRDLDEFVTRAKASNADHLEAHKTSVDTLSSTVESSFTSISAHFTSTFDRVRALGDEMDTDTATLTTSLEPLSQTICQPLTALREDITSTTLHEYEPTGQTPQRLSYTYPTTLPRTQPPEVLLAGMEDDISHLVPPTPSRPSNPPPTTSLSPEHSSSLSPLPTVTTKQIPTVFHDTTPLDLDLDTDMPPLQATRSRSSTAGTLREVNPNLTTGNIVFDAGASIAEKENHTLPLFKKSRTTRTTAAGMTKKTGGKGMMELGVDQRENVPPVVSGPGGKRKSPRLN